MGHERLDSGRQGLPCRGISVMRRVDHEGSEIDDNVLGLCVAATITVVAVDVEPGAFADMDGRPSPAASQKVEASS